MDFDRVGSALCGVVHSLLGFRITKYPLLYDLIYGFHIDLTGSMSHSESRGSSLGVG